MPTGLLFALGLGVLSGPARAQASEPEAPLPEAGAAEETEAEEPAEPEAAEAPEEPEEPEEPAEPEGTADEEITVVGELEIRRRRAEVDKTLRVMNYREGVRKDDKVVYRPEIPWKPSVEVHDEGYVIIKRSPVRFAPPTAKQRPVDYLWCVPPFTPLCFRVGGQVVSDAKLQPQKGRVAQGIDPSFRHWREAIVANAWAERVGEEIPDQLEAVWAEGVPFEGEGELVSAAERRQALLDFWSGRACTPEGAEVREMVALFLEYEVQDSPTPLTPGEVAAANEASLCGDRLPASLLRTPAP